MSRAQAWCEPIAGYLPLDAGETHHRVDGPADGAPVVLIHGATVPHWEFDDLAPRLVEAGRRVFRFDLLGHGDSARPRGRYDRARFVRQARDYIDAMAIDPGRLTLWGHSMGAAVAAALAAELPRRPAALVLMAPMLDFSAANPYAAALRTPLAGELLMTAFGRRALIRRRRRRYAAIGRPELAERFVEQARRRGFWRALLAMERHGALGDQQAAYRAAARAGCAPIIVHGSADAIVPRTDTERIVELFDAAEHIELPGLEHNLMLTHPARVARVVLAALADRAGAVGSAGRRAATE